MSPSDRFMDWLLSAQEPDGATAKVQFRELYRLPSMVFFFKSILALTEDADRLSGHDLTTEEGRLRALSQQGYIQGLQQVLNLAVTMAIPEETENG